MRGLADDQVCIGDRYRIGEAEFEVTQPRVTCYRVGIWMDDQRMPALLVAHHRPGFYLRVLREGRVRAGEDIRVLDLAERPRPAAVVDHDFWLIDDRDVLLMRYDASGRFMAAELLPPSELPRYQAARDAALAAAEPFGPWWQRHPEYYQVNNQAA